MIYLDPDLLKELKPYTDRHERSGFIQLWLKVGLALLSASDKELESAADHLAVSCETLDDLADLAQRIGLLKFCLWQRYDAASGE